MATLPGGRVLGTHRAVITGNGDLVMEVSRYWGTKRPREQPLFLNPTPPPPLHVPGRLGVLAGRGDTNYYHLIIDILPRLGMLEQCPDVERPERWYVPDTMPFHGQLLDLLGIPAEQRIDADEHPHVQADELVVPSLITEKNPPWMVAWLRSKLLPRRAAGRAAHPDRAHPRAVAEQPLGAQRGRRARPAHRVRVHRRRPRPRSPSRSRSTRSRRPSSSSARTAPG